MNLNFNELPVQREYKRGKFIRPGIQNLILKDIKLQKSPNNGTERPEFHMETEPIIDEGWEGFEGVKGQIGKIYGNFGFYLRDDRQKKDFMTNLQDILKATGSYDDFMTAHGSTDFGTLESVIEAVKPFVTGSKARYFVAGEQYSKLDGSGVGLKLKFPSRLMVEAIDSESKFPTFDEKEQNHFKKLTPPTAQEQFLEKERLKDILEHQPDSNIANLGDLPF